MVSNPSSEFDGSAVVTFRVDTMEDYVDEVAFVQTAKSQSLSSSSSRETSMKVTFYHCEAGTFWNMFSGANHPSVGCELCSGAAVGNTKVCISVADVPTTTRDVLTALRRATYSRVYVISSATS